MATGHIETHLHHSFNWENGASGPLGTAGGVRLTAGTTYLPDVFAEIGN